MVGLHPCQNLQISFTITALAGEGGWTLACSAYHANNKATSCGTGRFRTTNGALKGAAMAAWILDLRRNFPTENAILFKEVRDHDGEQIPELGFVFVGDFFAGSIFMGWKSPWSQPPVMGEHFWFTFSRHRTSSKSKELVVGVAQEELNRRGRKWMGGTLPQKKMG